MVFFLLEIYVFSHPILNIIKVMIGLLNATNLTESGRQVKLSVKQYSYKQLTTVLMNVNSIQHIVRIGPEVVLNACYIMVLSIPHRLN